MKCLLPLGGLNVFVLLMMLSLSSPLGAQSMDRSDMATSDIMSQMKKSMDGLNDQGCKGRGLWNHGFPDPKAFEFLLDLNIEHVVPIRTRDFQNTT